MPPKPPSDTPKGIRGIDPKIWKRVKGYAYTTGQTVGEVINAALDRFLKLKGT